MIQTKFGFHWSSTFRGEDFLKSLQSRRMPGELKIAKNIQFLILKEKSDMG
jgi:hypothetical protein